MLAGQPAETQVPLFSTIGLPEENARTVTEAEKPGHVGRDELVRPVHAEPATIEVPGRRVEYGPPFLERASGLPDHVHTYDTGGRCMAAGCNHRRAPVFGPDAEPPAA
jgi:hypothetical protein